MLSPFESAYAQVAKLVEKFDRGLNLYLSPNYNESEARKHFIDKFFIALGWDVNHDHQIDPYQQEVRVERTQSNQKRADYVFYLSPNFKDPVFFVEAKKPAANLLNADYYFQTIKYGWNATTPIAILTDFEEFHILDCRNSPDIRNIFSGDHRRFHFKDYLNKEKFSLIYFLFSKEAVQSGSIQRYVDGMSKPKGKAFQKSLFKKGVQPIDDAFLLYIDDVRTRLAKAFKRNDLTLTSQVLTEATQKTIDRLVFIRFLEDKLIEQENYISEFGELREPWDDFISLSRQLDAKYNGVVFKKHLIDDSRFAGPDSNEFRSICNDICHLNSPFDFNIIPVHILGSIYERFLGKVIHATEKQVRLEEKPEVRAAGGVFYTPKVVVDYMVKETVAKVIDGKTPEQISKMKFADIACGSGSFLISIFESILDYHNKYYHQNPAKAKKHGCYIKDGRVVLSIRQKQQILLNNIFGVDLDSQAVEVTQLSLALKMLEDETTATANEMQVLFHEKILPDLTKNIVVGNSLMTFEEGMTLEEENDLNPFNFESAFPEIFSSGGFDIIVGNPPYVSNKDIPSSQKYYFSKSFKTAVGQYDLYTLFIEKALNLIKSNGLLTYIIPDAIIDRTSAQPLREFIYTYSKIECLIQMNNVFDQATVGSAIITVKKASSNAGSFTFIKASSLTDFVSKNFRKRKITQKLIPQFRNYSFLFVDDAEWGVIKKVLTLSNTQSLEEVCVHLSRGEELGKKSDITKDKPSKVDLGLVVGEDVERYGNLKPKRFIAKNNVFKPLGLYGKKIVVRQVGNQINSTIDYKGYVTIQSVYNIVPARGLDHHWIFRTN